MDSTSVSLLRRLQSADSGMAWERFVELYSPLIYQCARRQGLSSADAADLLQEVLAVLVSKLPDFQYDSKRQFRSWLRTVTRNKVADFHRRRTSKPRIDAGQGIEIVADTASSDLFEESEYRRYLAGRALKIMRDEFSEKSWQAVWKHVVDGVPAREIATELEMTVNAVYLAKSRVLARLREELEGLLD